MVKRYVLAIVAIAMIGLFGAALAQQVIGFKASDDLSKLPWVIEMDQTKVTQAPDGWGTNPPPSQTLPEPIIKHPIDPSNQPNSWTARRFRDTHIKPVENKGRLFPKPGSRKNDYVKGQLVIGIKQGSRGKYSFAKDGKGILTTGLPGIDALNAKYGATDFSRVHEELPANGLQFNLDQDYVLYLPKEADLEAAAKEYRRDPNVEYAHPDYIPMVICVTQAPWVQTGLYDPKQIVPSYPNDVYFDWAPSILQVPRARGVTGAYGNGDGTGGAHPDTFLMLDIQQIRTTHEEFANGRIAATGGTSPTGTSADQHGHMCTAHAIGAMNNSVGIAGPGGGNGTTPGILAAYYRFTSSSENATGITWGQNLGVASIAQASLYFVNTEVLEKAFIAALNAGIPAYISAGNDRSEYNDMYPAFYSCVTAVGGIDWAGRHWAWDDTSGSCYGDWVGICGPGDSHWSANSGSNTAYTDGYGGTSWAAPEVAAIAALCNHVTGLTGIALQNAVLRTANSNDHINQGLDALTIPAGWGGAGIANAYEAVTVRDRNASVDFVSLNSAKNNYLNHGDMYIQSAMQPSPDMKDTIFKNDAMMSHGVWQFDRTLVPDVTVYPRAMVHNHGIAQASFNVTASNGGTYTSTKTVTLGSGKGSLVTFDGWTPTGTGAEALTVYSDLTGDQNRLNDTVKINLTKAARDTVALCDGMWDVGWIDANAAWAVKFEPERLCTLTAIKFYRNRKKTTTTAPAWACSLRVWDAQNGLPGSSIYSQGVAWTMGGSDGWGYWMTVTLTTPQVISKPVYIGVKTWGGGGVGGTPGTNDTLTIGFDYRRASSTSYYYAGNTAAWGELGTDPAIYPVVGYAAQYANDLGIDIVHAPTYGSLVKGFAYVPKAKVTNYGSSSFTGNVFCHMDSVGASRVQKLTSTKAVSSLAPGATQEVVFDPVTLGGSGTTTYNMDVTVSRSSGTDNNSTNDSIRTVTDTVRASAEISAGEGSAAYYTSTNRVAAVRFVPPGACQVTAGKCMYYRWTGTATPSCTCWVYSDNSGQPGSSLGQVVVAAQNTWYSTWSTYTFGTPVNVGSSPFWILFSYATASSMSPLMDGAANNGRSYVSADRSSWGLAGDNWLIHAVVQYSSLPAYDLGVQSLDAPGSAINANFSVTPKATIKNGGTNTLTGYNVQCTMTDSASGSSLYSQTLAVTLLPGEQTQLSYPAFTPIQNGRTIYYKVKRTSGTDNNAANDSLVTKIITTDLTEILYDDGPAFISLTDGGGSNNDSAYHAVRFTTELPCSLVGAWHCLYNSRTTWTKACSTFAWYRTNGSMNWPSDRYILREQFSPTSTGRLAWFRRTITPTYFNSGEDFWLGNWTPRVAAASESLQAVNDSWADYGRSFFRWNPRDSASNGLNYTWLPWLGDFCISALVKYLGGPSHTVNGMVNSAASETNLSFRTYLTKNLDQVVAGNVSGASISLLSGNQAYWQFDAKHFWPSWNRGDTMLVIVDREANSGFSNHAGYYAVMDDTLLIDVSGQTMNTATMRPIPVPVASSPGAGSIRISWPKPDYDAGKPSLNPIIGYRVYRSTNGTSFNAIGTTTTYNDTTYLDSGLPNGTYYYAIKLRYRGSALSKGDPKAVVIESNYYSANSNGQALAVSFANMSALVLKNDVTIKWRTESEHNSFQWLVERSDDGGTNYSQVGTVPARGNSTVPTDYEYQDNNLAGGKVFFYRLGELDLNGDVTYYGPISVGPLAGRPNFYALGMAQPNPFTRSAAISYQLKEPGRVSIRVYSITGQLIKSLVDASQEADYYQATWDGTNNSGQKVAAGVYLYRMDVNGFSDMKKALYLR